MTKNNLIVFILTIGVFSILNTEMGVIGILPIVASTYNIEISVAGLLVICFSSSRVWPYITFIII